ACCNWALVGATLFRSLDGRAAARGQPWARAMGQLRPIRAAVALWLLASGLAWCHLSRGAAGSAVALSARSAKSGRQERLGSPDSRRSLRPAPLRGLVRELSPGLAQVQLCWDGGQASPFFGSLRQGQARLLKGQEVSVHILPLDEPGLQLRLTDEGALTGTSLRKGPGQPADQKSPGAVPKKGDRAVERVNWIDAEPLPYLLCGAVAPCVRASVLAASAEKAEARLFWDSPLGEQLSPLVATISAKAVQEVFNLTNVKCSDYLHENQPVSLALSGETWTLSPRQPVVLPPVEGDSTSLPPPHWQRRLRSAKLRPSATAAAWRRDPDEVISAVEAQFGPLSAWKLSPELGAAASLMSTGQDLAISGAMPVGQRLGLLTFLIALHLQRLPNAPPTPPAVLFLGAGAGVRLSRFCGRKTEERTEEHWKQVEAQTLAGSPSEVLAKVNGDGYLLSRVSLVVVEMPIAGRQQKELKALLARLPAGRWPSILWQREDSDCGLEELLVDRPARLHLANALYGAKERVQVVSDHLPSVALAARRLPRQSVVIFAKAKDQLWSELRKALPPAVLEKSRLRVLEPEDALEGVVDVIIHTTPPPNQTEYFQRLASCRDLAMAHIVTKKVNGESRLEDDWLDFARYAVDVAADTGSNFRRLRQLIRKTAAALAKRKKKPADWTESFEEDYVAGESKEPVWRAGVAETDAELIFDAGL
ncbi:unnamed protein product, partial [Effrenium voratum]